MALALLLSGPIFLRPPTAPADDRYLSPPAYLPYRFADLVPFGFLDEFQRGWLRRGALCEGTGDGVPDLVEVAGMGPNLRRACDDGRVQFWQSPLPVEYAAPGAAYGIDGVWVFADSLGPEALVKAATPDRARWRFERRLVADGGLTAAFEIPGGSDRRGDGTWDGHFLALGVEEVRTADGPTAALILLAEAGHDLQPRGALALDPDTGGLLWEYRTGPKPGARSARLVDLDADGRREIVFLGSATGNIKEDRFNGTRDDTARIFVLEPDGRLRWSCPLGEHPANGDFAVLDVDGDGRLEVAAGENCTRCQKNRLLLLDHRGRVRATMVVGEGVACLEVLDPTPGRAELLVNQADGSLTVVSCGPTGFTVRERQRFLGAARVGGVLDVLPEPGPEIFLRAPDNQVWVLDRDLEPLAHLADGSLPLIPDGIALVRGCPDGDYLISAGDARAAGVRFVLEENPRAFPWAAVVGVSALGSLVPVMRWQRRRRRRLSSGSVRELRLQLLDRLMLSSHGAIGSLSTLRRFIWNLDTMVQGFISEDQARQVFPPLGREILGHGLPNLESALELAGLARLDEETVGAARQASGELAGLLGPLADEGFPPTAMLQAGEGLKQAAGAAEAAFQALRVAVERSISSDLAALAAHSLQAHAAEIASGAVKVVSKVDQGLRCSVDAEELAFVIDNLIENALRAMQGAERRELRLACVRNDRWLEFTVSDTGCGIIPDDWLRIFEPAQSERAGGGLGLSRSREVLRKYGGALAVKDSRPGLGTIMQMTVPAAGDPGP